MNHHSAINGPRPFCQRTRPAQCAGMPPTVQNVTAMLAAVASLLLANAAGAADAAQQQAMAKAGALLKTAGVACTVADARKLSPAIAAKLSAPPPATKAAGDAAVAPPTVGNQADAGGQTATSAGVHGDYGASPTTRKPAAADAYEVTCTEGLGYVISAVGGKDPFSYLCIEAVPDAVTPGVAPAATGLPSCELPGNLPAAQLSAVHTYVTQAGIVCEPTHMRSLGQTETDLVLELACVGGSGYILSIPYPLQAGQPVRSANCLSLAPGGRVSCELTDVTAQRAVSEVQMRQARPACQISASRYMVSSLHGDNYFEFLCGDGTGFVLQQKATGEVAGTVSCAAAVVAKLGGCQLGKTNP